VLWTPGYWGYDGSRYGFNEGYWGPSVGFYGGIDYGYGYGGQGYYGGEWSGNVFRYNTAVTRVNTTVIRNTYVNREVVRNNTGTRASFNGRGGATARPSAQELAAAKAEHVPPTPQQRSRVEAAKNNPDLRAAKNQGKPKAEAINALDRNNGTQPATAAAGGRASVGKQAGAGKATGAAAQRANGNSAFGRKQGDATTRTKGSQNNAYGKAQSAGAHSSRAAAAPRAPQTERSRPNRESVRMASAPRAQAVSHRPQGASVRQVGPAAKGRAPAGSPQSGNKKKKPADGKPGGG
jgi:hypothetical protein